MAPPNEFRVFFLGDVNLDLAAAIDELPNPGDDVAIKQFNAHLGGSATNSAIQAARLGLNSFIVGAVGDDAWGQQAIDSLQFAGVDTTYIHKKKNLFTGIIFIAVSNTGERTMYSFRGANQGFSPEDLPPREGFSTSKLLHLSGYAMLGSPQSDAFWTSVEFCKQAGVPISLDLCPSALQKKEDLQRLLPFLSILALGKEEAESLSGFGDPCDSAKAFCDMGIQIVAIKLGGEGAVIHSPQEKSPCRLPGFKIHVIDTTGAGDSFCAGLIYGFFHPWKIKSIGILANALGALTSEKFGAGLSLPTREELTNFLYTQALINPGLFEPDDLLKHFLH